MKYVKNIDGLRALAALGVIFGHSLTYSPYNNKISKGLAIIGNSGVSLFFVISGFVITRILINSRNSENYFKVFYIRRSLRIFPLYYGYLLLVTFLPLLLFPERTFNPPHLFIPALYLQNIYRTFNWGDYGPGHFWSLAVEEHFYLMWPAILYFTFKTVKSFTIKNIYFLVGIIVMISLACKIIFTSYGFSTEFFTFIRMDQIALGAILAGWEHTGTLHTKGKLFRWVLVCSVLVAVILGYTSPVLFELFKYNLIALIYFSIIGLCILQPESSFVSRFLESKPMRFSGRISYGLYVFHPLVFLFMYHWFHLHTGYYAIDLLLLLLFTVLVSYLSYNYYEKYLLDKKHHFKYTYS